MLLAMAVIWDNVSPALYRQILSEDVLSLPTQNYVRRLSGGLKMDTGLPDATVDYLRTRYSGLKDKEREQLVNLMLDDIAIAEIEVIDGKCMFA